MTSSRRGLFIQSFWQTLIRLLALACTLFVLASCGRVEGEPVGTARQRVGEASHVLSGTVYGGGVPLVNALVEAVNSTTGATAASCTTDQAGAYSMPLEPATYDLHVTPPPGSGFSGDVARGIPVLADTVQDIVLIAPLEGALLSGRVIGYGGLPVEGATLGLSGQVAFTATTNNNGEYALAAPAATYSLSVSGGNPALVPQMSSCSGTPLSLAGTTTLDLALPVLKISGVVADSNGAQVSGVQVTAFSSGSTGIFSYCSGWSSTSTDSTGHYELLAYAGSLSISISPAASSGFLPVAIQKPSLSGDLHQSIILQQPDVIPPVIVSSPMVVHLSDTSVSINWQTNEAATSEVHYGVGSPGVTALTAGLSTSHSVTLTNLVPSTDYVYVVNSSDASGNGPASTAVLSFRTQDPPGDVTPPHITGGPTVAHVDQTSATIVWSTDEPASTVARYGLSEALGSTQYVQSEITRTHAVTIVGLTPATRYYVQVESTDPDGNGPTVSTILSFDTTSVPDTQPPIITLGPVVTSITMSQITVTWTTDEPATSGVSYNDGTAYFVMADSQLVTRHEMVLAGLRPTTTYTITVSSTDIVGNGPTLGGPVTATTEAAPDTTAPTISNVVVKDVSTTTARITWTTDEPASAQVAYGLVSGSPDGLTGDAARVIQHDVLLTGLISGRTYYFVPRSIDASGNLAEGPPMSFTTVADLTEPPLTVADCPIGSNVIEGTPGPDVLTGTLGNDCILGYGGDDIIDGLGGNDILIGGAGNDKLISYDGTDRLYGEDGDDALVSAAGNDLLKGGAGNDIMVGGAGNDIIEGGAGNDQISGEAGNDTLSGEDGHDVIQGGSGADHLNGNDGDDKLDAGAGDDIVSGGAGNDQIIGAAGNDQIYGDAGDDIIDGGANDDIIDGGAGNDQIAGGPGDDRIDGGDGNDSINGGPGNDIVSGGSGDDVIFVSPGKDAVDGGEGNDACNGASCELAAA